MPRDPLLDQSMDQGGPQMPSSKAGQRLFNRRYQLKHLLGAGGMGVVWLARDHTEEIDVALKFLPSVLVLQEREMQRLREEVRAGKELRHPRLVATYGMEIEDGIAAIVMEYVPGQTLRQKLDDASCGFFEPEEISGWVKDVCDGLSYLHEEAKRIHRDLKPANVMVDGAGRAKLMDFGISHRIKEGVSRHSKTGDGQASASSSTLAYASPQQLSGKPSDRSDDIYSLGATLYELLTGTPPFYRGGLDAVANQIKTESVTPILERRQELVAEGLNADIGKSVPQAWEDTVLACLEKEREKRPDNAGALWQALHVPAKATPSFISSPPPIPERTPLSAELAHATASDTLKREQRTQVPLAPAKAAPGFSSPARPAATKPASTSQAAAAAVQRPRRLKPMLALAAVLLVGGVGLWAFVSKPKEEAPKRVEDTAALQEAEQQRQRADVLEKLEREEEQKRLAIAAAAATAKEDAGRAAGPPAAASVSTSTNPPKTTALGGPSALPATATKDAPFENSLGMKFVPVPIGAGPSAGQRVVFAVWETRSKDYAAFMKSGSYTMSGHDAGDDWSGDWRTAEFNGVPVGRGEGERAEDSSHPVVNVSWEDATAFAQWLTRQERGAGRIGPRDEYRLPTDVEWSYAVGIGDKEEASESPIEKSNRLPNEYPWGADYPPTDRAGNYADSTMKAKVPGFYVIPGYTDGYVTTAPVGSIAANQYGLHDLGGNVSEWCQDQIDGDRDARVLRGGSCRTKEAVNLRSAYRDFADPRYRNSKNGFRCVLVVGGG